jgi:hypothetical protein
MAAEIKSLDSDPAEIEGFSYFEDGHKFIKIDGVMYYKTGMKTWVDKVLYTIPLDETFNVRKPKPLDTVVLDKHQIRKSPTYNYCTVQLRDKPKYERMKKKKHNRKKPLRNEYNNRRREKREVYPKGVDYSSPRICRRGCCCCCSCFLCDVWE